MDFTRRNRSALLLPALAFAAALFAAPLAGTAGEIGTVERVTDLARPGTFDPDVRVYVKGTVPLTQEQLESIEGSLDTEHPDWYFVAVADAAGEEITVSDGVKRGYEAVQYALGHGLAQ